jgi:flagellar biosynthesis protein FliR
MTYEQIHYWMLAFIRAGGLLSLAPVFSGKSIPVVIRVAIAAFLGYSAGGFMQATMPLPGDVITLIFGATHELVIGLLMGLGVRLIFYAIELAGQIMSTEMGLMMSSQIDPISQNNSTPVGTALFYLGSLLFLLSGAHHAMFAAFLRSFEIAPPGTLAGTHNVGELFVQSTGSIFLIAVQMAAPLLAINFIVTLTFAILGKAAPSMNVFAESFSVRIFAGLALLALTLGLTAQLVLSHVQQSPELMLRLIP